MDADIYIVGIGPGDPKHLTPLAKEVIDYCQVVVAYDGYFSLVEEQVKGKKAVVTPMRKEVERCQAAIDEALAGQRVVVICSGDAGIYGLAGLVYELSEEHPQLKIEVIPGITAATSSSALLGAPLIHDFALISLSDLLTPWEKIEKRITLASEADFVLAIYNPRSKKRRDHLLKACDYMLKYKSPQTPCGYVQNIARQGEKVRICTLEELRNDHQDVDMFTTLIIGNSQTKVINGKMVTPRGYKIS